MNPLEGSDWDVINQAITGGSDTEVVYSSHPIKSFSVWARNGSAIQIRRTSGATNYVVLQPGEKYEAKIHLTSGSYASASIGFFRTDAAGGNDVIQGFVVF